MTVIRQKIQEFWLFLATYWFVLLCVCGFCYFAVISAQGSDPLLALMLNVLLWIFAPSLIYVIWFTVCYREKRKVCFKSLNLVVYVVCGALSFSTALLRWPLHLNFLVSRPALTQEIQKLAVQDSSGYPRWVGGFHILEANVERGSLCFWTYKEYGGRTGLVYNPQGGEPFFNLWSSASLGGNWHVITED